MQTLSVRPEEAGAELAGLDASLTETYADLPRPLVLKWTDTALLTLDRRGAPWWYGPVEQDPMRDRRGRTVIPRKQRRELRAMASRGVPFQRLAIAHELDARSRVPEALQHGPLICTDEMARELVGPTPAHPGVTWGARALDAVIGNSASTGIGVLDHLLDPIVFGIIAPTMPRDGGLCLWYPLVAWRW